MNFAPQLSSGPAIMPAITPGGWNNGQNAPPPLLPALPGRDAPTEPNPYDSLAKDYQILKAQTDRGEIGQTQLAIEILTCMREGLLTQARNAHEKHLALQTERTAYVIVNLNKQIMEVTNELRRLEDFSAQVGKITEIIADSIKQIGLSLISEIKPVMDSMSAKDKEQINQALRRQFAFMNEIKTLAEERARNLFTPI